MTCLNRLQLPFLEMYNNSPIHESSFFCLCNMPLSSLFTAREEDETKTLLDLSVGWYTQSSLPPVAISCAVRVLLCQSVFLLCARSCVLHHETCTYTYYVYTSKKLRGGGGMKGGFWGQKCGPGDAIEKRLLCCVIDTFCLVITKRKLLICPGGFFWLYMA